MYQKPILAITPYYVEQKADWLNRPHETMRMEISLFRPIFRTNVSVPAGKLENGVCFVYKYFCITFGLNWCHHRSKICHWNSIWLSSHIWLKLNILYRVFHENEKKQFGHNSAINWHKLTWKVIFLYYRMGHFDI